MPSEREVWRQVLSNPRSDDTEKQIAKNAIARIDAAAEDLQPERKSEAAEKPPERIRGAKAGIEVTPIRTCRPTRANDYPDPHLSDAQFAAKMVAQARADRKAQDERERAEATLAAPPVAKSVQIMSEEEKSLLRAEGEKLKVEFSNQSERWMTSFALSLESRVPRANHNEEMMLKDVLRRVKVWYVKAAPTGVADELTFNQFLATVRQHLQQEIKDRQAADRFGAVIDFVTTPHDQPKRRTDAQEFDPDRVFHPNS